VSNAIKIGAAVVLIAGWFGYEWIRSRQPVSFKITDFGIPSINGSIVTLPLTVTVENRTGLSIPIDDLRVVLSYLQNGSYVATGALSQARVNVQPGTSNIKLSPTIDVRALFGNVLDTLATVLQNRGIDIKADIVMNFQGVTLSKSFTKKINV
jgi:hypothetical protein